MITLHPTKDVMKSGETWRIQVRPLEDVFNRGIPYPHVFASLRHGANLIRPLRGRR